MNGRKAPVSSHNDGIADRFARHGVDGAAEIIEHLLLESEQPIDRAQIRRVVWEAIDAYPGEPLETWWRWLGEAGANLGLKCRVIDCTLDEMRELVAHGVRIVLFVPEGQYWRAVTGMRRRRYRLAEAGSKRPSRWGNRADLRRLAGNPAPNARLRCVSVEPSMAYVEAVSSHAEELTPLSRLLALLRPEKSDLLILLVFAVVAGLLTLATPVAVESLVSTVAFGRLLQPIFVLTLLLLAFLLFSAAIRVLQTYVVEIIQCRFFARVASDLAFRIPRIRLESVDGQYMPELVNRFFDVVTVQKTTAKLLLDGLYLVLSTVVGMVVLAFYHPWLLAFDAVLLAMLAAIVFVMGRGAVATSIKESKLKYQTAAWLEDLARCAVTFKYDGGAEFALERTDQLAYQYLSARKKHFQILMRQIIFALSVQALASAALLGIGGWLVMIGQLTLGQLVAAELIVAIIVGSFAKLGYYLEIYYDLLAAVDKLGVLFDLPVEQQEGVLHTFPTQPAGLTIHDVDYQHPDGNIDLEKIRMEIRPGEKIALQGPGPETRTLFDLIYGLRTPAHGHVSLDGIDPRDLRPDFLRRRVALVRGCEVFHSTISENVHLARPEVTVNAVRDALELVGLLDDVLQLPNGIETELDSAGSPLTENQLRRLVLARAAVGRPGLMMLDGILDPFADDEAEELMRMLGDKRMCWSLLLVTNRASLVSQCDRTVEIPHGRVFPQEVMEMSIEGGDES